MPGALLVVVAVGGFLLLPLGQRFLLFHCPFRTPQPSRLPGYGAHSMWLGFFVEVVLVALVDATLPVHIRS